MDAVIYTLLAVALLALLLIVWCCLVAASKSDDVSESWSVKAKQKAWSGEIPHYTPPTLSGRAAKGIRPKDAA